MKGSDTARHARSLADKLRRAAEEAQSPWIGEGTCLVFADAAKTLEVLLERVDSLEAALQNAADALHDAAWIMEGAKTEPPLPPPISLVLPQTKRVEKELRVLAAVGAPPEQTGCALKGCLGLDENGVCPNGYGGICEAIFLEPSNMDEDPLAVPPEQTP